MPVWAVDPGKIGVVHLRRRETCVYCVVIQWRENTSDFQAQTNLGKLKAFMHPLEFLHDLRRLCFDIANARELTEMRARVVLPA